MGFVGIPSQSLSFYLKHEMVRTSCHWRLACKTWTLTSHCLCDVWCGWCWFSCLHYSKPSNNSGRPIPNPYMANELNDVEPTVPQSLVLSNIHGTRQRFQDCQVQIQIMGCYNVKWCDVTQHKTTWQNESQRDARRKSAGWHEVILFSLLMLSKTAI